MFWGEGGGGSKADVSEVRLLNARLIVPSISVLSTGTVTFVHCAAAGKPSDSQPAVMGQRRRTQGSTCHQDTLVLRQS